MAVDIFDSALLEKIAADVIPIRPPGLGITARELANKTGLNVNKAKDYLDAKVANGEMENKPYRTGGHVSTVYWNKSI